MRERVTVVLFLSVCLSVCENNIWELTPLQPLKCTHQMGEDHTLLALNVPVF